MNELLDHRNLKLWERISKTYKINFENSENDEYSCYTKDDSITFYIGKGELSKDSFTHEMLHIYFKVNNCFIGGGLTNILLYNNRLGKILNSELIEHIGNCFEHIKMFPIYLEMGFEKAKFLKDYSQHKCQKEIIYYLNNNYYSQNEVNLNIVHLFIGTLVAILADPNDDFNYDEELKVFQKLDETLFLTIQSAVNTWGEIEIENTDVTKTNYHDLIFNLEYDLEKWYDTKIQIDKTK